MAIRKSTRLAVLIRNNLFLDINGPAWNGAGMLFQILEAPTDLIIDHNTAMQTGNVVTVEGPPATGFVFTNNIAQHNAYGIIGSDSWAWHFHAESLVSRGHLRAQCFH